MYENCYSKHTACYTPFGMMMLIKRTNERTAHEQNKQDIGWIHSR